MSLFDCLGKHGNIFTPAERADLRALAKSNVDDGLSPETAEIAAVEESLTEAKADLQEVLEAVQKQIGEPGMVVPPDTHEMLRLMAENSGWAESGGQLMVKNQEGRAGEQEYARTQWLGKPDWAKASSGANMTVAEIKVAVEKAIAGKELTQRQHRMVEGMLADLQESRSDVAQAGGEALPADEQAIIAAELADGPTPASWLTMSKDEQDAELNALFPPAKSVAQGAGSGAQSAAAEVRPEEPAGPAEREPGQDDEEVAPPPAGGFDSEAFDRKRADAIKASREAGNVHLDKVLASVETMRGREIFYVHDTKQRGVIRTVDNRGNVYVYWADKYSADKEMASESVEDNKAWLKSSKGLPYMSVVRDGKSYVMESSLGPSDMKDYAFADKRPAAQRPALDLAAQSAADIAAKEKQAATGTVEEKTAAVRDRNEAILTPPAGTAPPRDVFEQKVPTQQEGLFSRVPPAVITADSIRETIAPLLAKWENAPSVRVIQSMADAPQAMRLLDNSMRSQGATGVPEAFIYKNAVYLVADGLTPARVTTALFHESLGHFGLRGTFGEKLNPILDRVAFDFKDRVAAKASAYGFDMKDAGQRRQAAEEVLAELAQTRPQHGLVRRLIAAIRQFLRDVGLNLKLSDNDLIANYILPARGFVERARTAPAAEPAPAFSRAEALTSARTLFDNITRSDRVLNRVISKFNTPFHIAETHPEFKPVYEEAQDFNQDVSRVVNETADLAPDLLPRVEAFADFKKSAPSNEDIASTANSLYAGTLWGGGSPLEGRVWTDEELKSGRARDGNITIAAFDPVNDQQIKLYRQALASVGHSLTEHAQSLVWRLAKQKDILLPRTMPLARMVAVADELAGTQIEGRRDRMRGADDETRASAEREIQELDAFRKSLKDIQAKTESLISHGYFPAMRFGQYAVNVQTLGTDGKWKEEFFGRYETQTAANLAKEELQREYPNATSQVTSGVMNNDAHKLFQGLNLDALELFSEHMRDDSGKPISADPIMQEYFRVAVTERSTLKRQIHRKGTPGFSRDVPRALAQFTVANATSASRNYHAADMLQKVQKIKAGDLQAYATRYVRYLQDPQEESPALRGFLANYYILGSIAFGAVNMTQPILMTAPYLSQHTSWPKAMAQLGRAAKDLVTGRKDLTPEEQAAYARATKAGIVSPQEIHQIRAESRASMMGDSPLWQKLEGILAAKGVTLPGKLLMRKAAFLWGSIYSMTEQFNRGTTFLASYRVAKANGEGDPYTFAKNAVDATQGVYARSNRPEVSRGAVGATIMTFKQFNIAYLELAKRLYDHDKKAFAVLMLTLMALAGAEGLPFAEDIEDLIDTIGQWMGYPTNAKKALRKKFVEMLGPDIADVMLHGASAIPGVPIDVANRMGMHNVIPGTAMLKTSEPDKTRDLLEILGPAATLFQNAGHAVTGLATGTPGDVKGMLPSALQNALKAAEMVDTGSYRDAKGRKVMDVDAVDAFSKMIGFQPAKVARETRIVGQNQQDIALHKVIEDSIASKWAHGTVDKDPAAVADAVRQWKEWNATNKDFPIAITGAQISRRIKELQMSREERFVKSAPKELRQGVSSDLRGPQ